MTTRTKDRLAADLKQAADETADAQKKKFLMSLSSRAATGEFDDFASTYVCPITQLHAELTAGGFHKFAQRVASGEYDATKEESDEWARSPEGQETLKLLPPEMRAILGMEKLQ